MAAIHDGGWQKSSAQRLQSCCNTQHRWPQCADHTERTVDLHDPKLAVAAALPNRLKVPEMQHELFVARGRAIDCAMRLRNVPTTAADTAAAQLGAAAALARVPPRPGLGPSGGCVLRGCSIGKDTFLRPRTEAEPMATMLSCRCDKIGTNSQRRRLISGWIACAVATETARSHVAMRCRGGWGGSH